MKWYFGVDPETGEVLLDAGGLYPQIWGGNYSLKTSFFDAYKNKIEIIWHLQEDTGVWTRCVPGISDPQFSTLLSLEPNETYYVKIKDGVPGFVISFPESPAESKTWFLIGVLAIVILGFMVLKL